MTRSAVEVADILRARGNDHERPKRLRSDQPTSCARGATTSSTVIETESISSS